jgi:vacuole morphology and inheritance protein 14
MARELMLPFTTLLINAILPSLSHPVSAIRSIAVETNNNLYRLVYDSTSDSLSVTSSQVMANLSTLSTPTMSNPLPPSVQGNDQLEIVEAVVTLVKHFQAEHEETRIAALDWLLMLHKNAPVKVFSF